MTEDVKKVLAIASAGGHWVQLRRLRPAWDDCEVVYVATDEGYRTEVMEDMTQGGARHPRSFYAVPDANMRDKIALIRQFFSVFWLVLKIRPDVIVSTGASSGFFALLFGRLIGAKRIWVDSIANAGELSASGRMIGRHANLWLTQWAHLAKQDEDGAKNGPRCEGSVI
jgi:UDP-N-acetylglucosamine:LPS N-acetylglucosamine transferase